jgi:hypothetical protein
MLAQLAKRAMTIIAITDRRIIVFMIAYGFGFVGVSLGDADGDGDGLGPCALGICPLARCMKDAGSRFVKVSLTARVGEYPTGSGSRAISGPGLYPTNSKAAHIDPSRRMETVVFISVGWRRRWCRPGFACHLGGRGYGHVFAIQCG